MGRTVGSDVFFRPLMGPVMPASTGNYSINPHQNLIQESQIVAHLTSSRHLLITLDNNERHLRKDYHRPRILDFVQP